MLNARNATSLNTKLYASQGSARHARRREKIRSLRRWQLIRINERKFGLNFLRICMTWMMSSPSFSFYTPLPPTTTSIFTPHQSSPTSPPFSYLPQTPSPLRTSCNANLMPPPPTPTAPTKSSPLADISNVWSTTSIFDQENAFTLSPSLSTSNNNRETTFSRRARSQSPITELSTRTSLARDRRKSLFLDQIRSKREDEKFESRGDQVLRMDWAREEAERKGMLDRQAGRLGMLQSEMEEEDYEDDAMRDGEGDGPSPTEERELEDLIRLHEESGTGGGEEDMMDELDDEDYDRLFMEIGASQEYRAHSGSQQQQVQQDPGFGWAQQDSAFVSGSAGVGGSADEVMDLS